MPELIARHKSTPMQPCDIEVLVCGTKACLFGSLSGCLIAGGHTIRCRRAAGKERRTLTQEALRERRAMRFLVAYPRTIPVAIFLLVAAITALSVYAIELGDHKREHAQLQQRAQAVASALERRSANMSSYLRAGAALFSTVEGVTPQLFERFVGNLDVAAGPSNSDGIGWAPRLLPDEVGAFERRYQTMVGKPITVFPSPSADSVEVAPIAYLRPTSERNDRALGFDILSEATRRQATEEAIQLGNPVASGKLVLKQEGVTQHPGFVLYMPVFEQGRTPKRVKGFLFAPFNAHDFVASALELETRGEKGIRLYDREIAPGRLLVELPPAQATGVTVTEPVMIGNHDMVLEVESARGNSLSPLSMLTMLFGIMVASLLMILTRLLTRQAQEDDAALAWLEEQNSIRNSLTRELNHRVKNTLANVLSIISLTRRRTKSLDDFADNLDGRVRALSATHDLLTQSEWGTTPIRDLIAAELAPYARQSETVLDMDGPDVEVAPNDALSLGLAIHELATNAAKYGALSKAGGNVTIRWKKLSDDYASLEWRETGGPAVSEERVGGFGTNLIEKIVAHELRNPVDLQFRPEGVTCAMTIPLREPSDFAIRAGRLA